MREAQRATIPRGRRPQAHQRFAAMRRSVFIPAIGESAHWLPVASIPPSGPPVQGEASAVSIFEVFTGPLEGIAALANRLTPSADTVDMAAAPDIFAVARVPAGAAVDCWIPLILAVSRGDAISEPSPYNPMVAASPH